jgi:hypothetical protein
MLLLFSSPDLSERIKGLTFCPEDPMDGNVARIPQAKDRPQVPIAMCSSASLASEVVKLEKVPHLPAGQLYDLACACSKSSVAALKDSKLSPAKRNNLSEQYAVRAMSFLSRALADGYSDAANLQNDSDLAPLRDRADFKKLLQQLEKLPQRGGE